MLDALIIGAGPAGSSAAYQLASRGLSVRLLDRSDFPRTKACAGGLTQKSIQILPFSIEPVIQRRFSSVSVSNRHGTHRTLTSSNPVCAMTVRAELDHFCLNQSLAAGATFQRISTLNSISIERDHVQIHFDATEWSRSPRRSSSSEGGLRARYLIGADGANSTVRRLSGLFPQVTKAIAVEACVSVPDPSAYPMTFDFFEVDRGYGWIFPKRDHLNIGLYSSDSRVRIDKPHLARYVAATTGQSTYSNFLGHHLGLSGQHYKIDQTRVFLVGDAAGLADPLFGEGIYYAIRSGQLVAQAILSGNSDPSKTSSAYDSLLHELRRDLSLCSSAARHFYSHPRLSFSALTNPLLKPLLMKGLSKAMTLGEIVSRFPTLPFLSSAPIR